MEKIRISDHFSFGKILKYTLAPVCMMIFSSIYTIVDGFFVANFASKEAFTAVNLIFPVIMIVAGVGFMFGTGGSAFVAALFGKKEDEKARQAFSMVIYCSIILGAILSIIFFFLVEPIVHASASVNPDTSAKTIENAILYGKIMIAGEVFFVLQNTFQPFFSVAEKPGLGFVFTLAAGLSNMLLDYILIGVLHLGVAGAAIASLIGMMVGSVGPLLYFSFNKKNRIYLGKPEWNFIDLGKIMINGSSEFVSCISSSIVTMAFNIQLLKYVGENGVSAYGIIMYVSYVFAAIFIGYSIGISPVISYNYGAKNKKELTSLFKKSLILIAIAALCMWGLAEASSVPFSKMFSSGSAELEALSEKAMRIYSFSYLIMGFTMFGSSFFTALNNGLISAVISIARTVGFQLLFVIVLPLLMGVDGIWWSIVFAEICSNLMTTIFLLTNAKKYGYYTNK